MSRKHLGMKRPVKQFSKAVDEMLIYLDVFDNFPPKGDEEKEIMIQRWKKCINDVIIQINNIKNTQIELLEREEEHE